MANFNANAAGVASASLIIESQRQNVTQPAEKPVTAAASSVALSEGDQVSFSAYTVKKGDTLWDIADAKLGDATKWPVLFALNREQIKNPDLIFPGQVLTVPNQVDAAPQQPKPDLPNPVDYDPVPTEPQTPAQPVEEPIAAEPQAPPPPTQQPVSSVEEEIITRTETPKQISAEPVAVEPTPVAVGPEPVAIEPEPVAVEPEPVAIEPEPVAAEPPASKPQKPLLRHPSELPAPYDPTPVQVITEPTVEPDLVVTEPVSEGPAAEEPTQTQPETPKPQVPTVVGEASRAQPSSGVGKAALVGGAVGAIGTGAYLVGLTRGIGSNLGGYASAQVVAKGINSVTSKVGFKVPAGPALSKLVSKVGGPKVAGAVTAIAAGAVVAGVAAGGYYLYNKATSGGESAPEVAKPSPQPAPQPAQTSTQPVGNDPAVADVQPVVDANAPAPVDLSGKFQKLEQLLDQKQYMYFGKLTQPEDVRATGVQIWLEGNVSDRVKLANILVDNSQAELLGRVMSHEETNPLEIAQVMSQPDFPVQGYMNGLDDNQAFLVLNSLSTVAATGEPSSMGVISKTIQGYDRMIDREAPFDRLKNHHMAQGTWEALPASLRAEIDQLIK